MPQKTVKVMLRGGLGNQLFQYGAGFALAKNLGGELLLDASLLPNAKRNQSGISRWPAQIGEFRHQGSLQSSFKSPSVTRLRSIAFQLERSIGDKTPAALARFGRFSNEKKAANAHFQALRGNRIIINSYCNSSSYFLEHGQEIRDSIRDLKVASESYKGLAEEASRIRPLAVHIRLGDYRNLSHIYGRFDPEYVREAINFQFALTGERPVWLFSDDPALALGLTRHIGHRLETQPAQDGVSALETMLVMSKCDGLVASNSSFSWWAGYLSESLESKVIFPRPFFAPTGPEEPKDWLLPSWIQIGRAL